METNLKYFNNFTEPIVNLLQRLLEIYEQKDEVPIIEKLKLLGFQLYKIEKNGLAIIGNFRNFNFDKKLFLPYYKINEDVLEQLEALIEDYNDYLFQIPELKAQNQINKISSHLLDINLEKIDWDKVYSTSIYAKLALEVAIELLFFKLNEYLRSIKYFRDLD